jgi:hypothetical protein
MIYTLQWVTTPYKWHTNRDIVAMESGKFGKEKGRCAHLRAKAGWGDEDLEPGCNDQRHAKQKRTGARRPRRQGALAEKLSWA